MTRVKHSLFSVLAINLDTQSIRRRDVVVQVARKSRGGTTITINDGDVVLELTEGERIALIEALDGQV